MAGILGIGTFTSPRRRDARDFHQVTNETIQAMARSQLPSPPDDKAWARREDGDWHLVDKPAPEPPVEAPPAPAAELPPAREHVVLPGETLPGLCLRYKTTARALARANPSLDAKDQGLRGIAIVRIPGDGPTQPVTEEVNLARLRASCPGLSLSEARFYLSDAASVEDAIARARDDDAWEREQRKAAKAPAGPPPRSAPVIAVAHQVPVADACEAPGAVDAAPGAVDAEVVFEPTAVGDAVLITDAVASPLV